MGDGQSQDDKMAPTEVCWKASVGAEEAGQEGVLSASRCPAALVRSPPPLLWLVILSGLTLFRSPEHPGRDRPIPCHTMLTPVSVP